MYLGARIATQSDVNASFPTRCALCPVRSRAICASLPVHSLACLSRTGHRRMLRKGQTLRWEGDDTPLALTVISGMLKLSSAARGGSEQIVGLIGPGCFAGKPFGGVTHERITAIGDAELCIFSSAMLRDLAGSHPEIMASLLEQSILDLDRARQWMRLLGRGSASERVAALLLEMTGDRADSAAHPLPLSRGEMADFTGLTIETVSRQLSRLRDAGVIAVPTRNSFELRDRSALAAIAGATPRHELH